MAGPRVGLPAGWRSTPQTLTGKVVLVTGASGGLGGAVARAVVAAGAQVVIAGRRRRPLEVLYDQLQQIRADACAIQLLDLETATPDGYAAVAEAIEAEFGRLDGLVHAAASFTGLTPLAMHKPDAWLRALHVNVSAPFALTQACLPLLEASADGAVVFALDDPERMRRAHWGGYGVAKVALEGLLAIWQQETEQGSVRVHGLLPAPMRTGLRRAAYFGEAATDVAEPTQAAAAVIYLLSTDGGSVRQGWLDLRQPA